MSIERPKRGFPLRDGSPATGGNGRFARAAPTCEGAPSPYLLEAGPRCGPRGHYIKGHRNRAGHYVKGHCSHQRR